MERLTRGALAHPYRTSILLAVVTGVLGVGALRLQTDVGYRSLLGRSHPVVSRFDAFLARFGGGFPLAAVYDCGEIARCQSAFDADALDVAARIAARLADEAAIRRVDSPATTALLVPARDGEIAVRRLVEAGAPAPDRQALADRALSDSLWPRWLIGSEGRVGALVAEVASSRSRDQVAAYAALDAALAPHEARGYRFHRVGGPVEFVVAGGELAADTARMVPLMVVLVACVLAALFRSLAIVVAALVTVGAAVVWTFGAMGWLGWSANSVTQALPPLLLVIGVCDVIHLLARLASGAAAAPERSRHELVIEAVRDVGSPCLLTTLTTAAGFASFATSGLESFVRFGWAASFGVCAALFLTFTMLPLLAVRLPLAAVASHDWERPLRRVAAAAQRRARPLLLGTTLVALALGWGVTSLRVDASFEDLYGVESRVVRWARYVGDHLRRPDSLELEIRPVASARLNDPELLARVDAAARALATLEGLGPARSVVDWIALVHQLANDDDPFWRRLPGRESDIEEITSALDARDPGALARFVAKPELAFRVSIESEKLPQEALRRVFDEAHARLASVLPPDFEVELTGPLAVVHAMIDEIQRTQLWSFGVAALVVLVLVAAFLRSPGLALLAALPTLLPVVATLGAMGWWGAPLDVGSAMVAAVVIGIAVDDCIHVLSVYRRRRRAGSEPAAAMLEAIAQVGRAVVTTSLALALGFFTLTLSSWSTIAHFGALAGLAIGIALAAVLAVLPACVAIRGAATGPPRLS